MSILAKSGIDRRIGVLALASFAMGTESYVYAGHLTALSQDLNSDIAAAGQLASTFALTYAISAPFTARLISHFDRRVPIVAGLFLVGALNLLATLTSSLGELLLIRVLCGLAAGLIGPMASVAAAELAGPDRRGQAMAVVLAGLTLAFVLGIPAGSIVGSEFGWRGTFGYAGLVALLAAAAIAIVLPRVPGTASSGLSAFKAAAEPLVLRGLLLTLLGFASTFTVVAFIGPVVTAISGLTGSGVGAMQALIGVGSIAGIFVGGRSADKIEASAFLRASFGVSAIALSLYSFLIIWPAGPRGALLTLSAATIIGAAALFARSPVIQTAIFAATPAASRPVVLALNGSAVFLGQGLAAAIGGVSIHVTGLESLGFTGAGLAVLGALLVFRVPSQSITQPAERRC